MDIESIVQQCAGEMLASFPVDGSWERARLIMTTQRFDDGSSTRWNFETFSKDDPEGFGRDTPRGIKEWFDPSGPWKVLWTRIEVCIDGAGRFTFLAEFEAPEKPFSLSGTASTSIRLPAPPPEPEPLSQNAPVFADVPRYELTIEQMLKMLGRSLAESLPKGWTDAEQEVELIGLSRTMQFRYLMPDDSEKHEFMPVDLFVPGNLMIDIRAIMHAEGVDWQSATYKMKSIGRYRVEFRDATGHQVRKLFGRYR